MTDCGLHKAKNTIVYLLTKYNQIFADFLNLDSNKVRALKSKNHYMYSRKVITLDNQDLVKLIAELVEYYYLNFRHNLIVGFTFTCPLKFVYIRFKDDREIFVTPNNKDEFINDQIFIAKIKTYEKLKVLEPLDSWTSKLPVENIRLIQLCEDYKLEDFDVIMLGENIGRRNYYYCVSGNIIVRDDNDKNKLHYFIEFGLKFET
jgi:hypothetical protein